ncbi:MAG: pyrrolo-quinoline quinone [Planctomycetia bacterium]|nr:pyrrolo-quinoline quinone [Planctomycetia bacterium]
MTATSTSPRPPSHPSPSVRLPAAVLLWACVAAAPATARDWPTFRGADRTAVAVDTDLLESWPAGGPPLAWESAGAGRGHASLAIAGGRIFTLGDGLSTAPDADEYMSCFDRETGKQLWKTKTGPAWNEGQESWQSSRSTPTVDGDMVYVLSPHGRLVACATADGREIFSVDLKAQFGGKKGDSWGYSESVLVDGATIVCTPGGEKATMLALDKKTGRPVWACPMQGDRGAGHASIVIATVGGRRIYVQTTASGAFGVDAKTGRFLWSYPIEQTTAVIPTPIVRDDLVFFSAGYKRGGALLRQVPGPGDTVAIKEVYGLKPDLANKHGGIVLVGDHLYGDSDDKGIPFCADLLTGEVRWQKRGSGKGSASFVAADGHVYVRFSDGTLAMMKADPAAAAEVSSFKIPGSGDRPSWSHAVILDGRLYLREQDRILCYDIRQH